MSDVKLDTINEKVILKFFKSQAHQFVGPEEIKGLENFTSLDDFFISDNLAHLINGLFDLKGKRRHKIRKPQHDPPCVFDKAHHRDTSNLVIRAASRSRFSYSQLVENPDEIRRRKSQLAFFHVVNDGVAMVAVTCSRHSKKSPLVPFLKRFGVTYRRKVSLNNAVMAMTRAMDIKDDNEAFQKCADDTEKFIYLAHEINTTYGVPEIIDAEDCTVLDDYSTYLLSFMVAEAENPSANLPISQIHEFLKIAEPTRDGMLGLEVSVRNLPSMDDNSESDPVVALKCLGTEQFLCSTEYQLNNNNPDYQTILNVEDTLESFELHIIDMDVAVCNKSQTQRLVSEPIGLVNFTVSELFDVKTGTLTQARITREIKLSAEAKALVVEGSPAPTLTVTVRSLRMFPSFVVGSHTLPFDGVKMVCHVEHLQDGSFVVATPSPVEMMTYMDYWMESKLNPDTDGSADCDEQ